MEGVRVGEGVRVEEGVRAVGEMENQSGTLDGEELKNCRKGVAGALFAG